MNMNTSCNCRNIERNVERSGIPTNLSVYNCNTKGLDLNSSVFSEGIKPQPRTGYTHINPQVITQKFATDFQHFDCKHPGHCLKRQYINGDPRLKNNATGDLITLDTLPIDSSMKLADIPSAKVLDGYGQNYKTYKDINAGQIMYYDSKAIEEPYYSPNFVSSAFTTGYLFKDPMGAIKPYYDRVPVADDPLVGEKRDSYEGGLSWIQDSGNFRQDIMSKQMGLRNRQRWQPRWSQ